MGVERILHRDVPQRFEYGPLCESFGWFAASLFMLQRMAPPHFRLVRVVLVRIVQSSGPDSNEWNEKTDPGLERFERANDCERERSGRSERPER